MSYDVVTSDHGPEPITIDMVRANARIDHGFEDARLAGFIAAARAAVEAVTGALLRPCTLVLTSDGWPGALPRWPVRSIESIRYTDAAGAPAEVPAETYTLVQALGRPHVELAPGASWPALGRMGRGRTVLTAAGGPADMNAVPETIRAALLIMCTHAFSNDGAIPGPRAAGTDVERALYSLIAPHLGGGLA